MASTVPQITTISNKQFLQSIMGEYWQAAHVTGFIEDPGQLDTLDLRHYWGGTVFAKNPIENSEHNNFFVISTFQIDEDGKHRRRKSNFAAAYCMMIDDIGWGDSAKISDIDMLAFKIKPSWRLETSPGNFQYGYIFDEPVMDRGMIEALLKGFVALGLVDKNTDPGMLGCTRYCRLPVGSNTKARYGKPFPHVLHEWKPQRMYSIDMIADRFGIELKEFHTDDNYSDPLPLEQDLIYQSLNRLGLVKDKLREGIFDITCPWQSGHTEELDNGTAYLSPMGFKCHHGHCANRTGKDLLNWLHGQDPMYAEACSSRMPFVPVEVASTQLSNDTTPSVSELEFQTRFRLALDKINPNEPNSANKAYVELAKHEPNLTPAEKDHYLRLIKEESVVTIKVAREQLRHVRHELLKEHREKGILHEPVWVQFHEDRIVPCLVNFKAVCDYHGIAMAYNQMSHTIKCHIPSHDFSGEDLENRNLMFLRDMMQNYNLPYARVGEWMMGMSHEEAYHPFRDYLDRLGNRYFDPRTPTFHAVLDTLTFDEFPDEAAIFIRRWFISIIAAVRGHGGAGMKGVLTLAGKQGIGKTSWFRNLFPGGMFCEGLVLDPHNKDTTIQATNHLVCELGELDATFKRDIPSLKAFISKHNDEIRHPYAAKTSLHPRRTVFCATVNQTNFLVDQTGNSRFWPVSVSDCDFLMIARMQKTKEMDQFWFEVDQMYQACIAGRQEFRWWISDEEAGLLSEVSERFIRETAGESMLREHYNMDGPPVHQMATPDIMQSLGLRMADHNYTNRKNEVLEALRRITGQSVAKKFQVDGVRSYGYLMPQRKLGKMKPNLEEVPAIPTTDLPFM